MELMEVASSCFDGFVGFSGSGSRGSIRRLVEIVCLDLLQKCVASFWGGSDADF